MNFPIEGVNNECETGDNVMLTGWIKGNGNKVILENPIHECNIDIKVSGDNNIVIIKKPFAIKGLKISIGNHVRANKTTLKIDEGFSIEGGGQFLLYNSGNQLTIGKNCMFSNNIIVRCGDSPHLLFDLITGEYLDVSDGVMIGDHVWVGERVYITKKVTIPNDNLVAACSVVTKRFDKENCVLAGNPAKVVRENIQWIRNHSHLIDGSKYHESYHAKQSTYL